MTEMIPISDGEETSRRPVASAVPPPSVSRSRAKTPSTGTTQLLKVYGEQVATLNEQLAKAEAAAESERAERLRLAAEHTADRERWREAIEQAEAARAAEVERLHGGHETERQRINELVERLIAETAERERELTGAVQDAEARLSQATADIAALRAAHAVALDRLQADREAERKRIGDLVAQLIADTEAREQTFNERLDEAHHQRDAAQSDAARERQRAQEFEKRVERLSGTLDGLRRDREAEVATYEAMRDQCRLMASELERLRRPWWRRMFRR
ncbi:hypothetical protein [Azospirillum sp. sgz302134]